MQLTSSLCYRPRRSNTGHRGGGGGVEHAYRPHVCRARHCRPRERGVRRVGARRFWRWHRARGLPGISCRVVRQQAPALMLHSFN